MTEDAQQSPAHAAMADASRPSVASPWRRRMRWSTPPVPQSLLGRRTIVVELLVVLAVFPLRSTASALADLYRELVTHSAPASSLISFPGHVNLTSLVSAAYLVVYSVAPPFLVWYLLRREGSRMSAIGLDGRRLIRDVAIAVPLAALALGGHKLGIQLPFPYSSSFSSRTPHVPAILAVFFVVQALSAGILEEIVVVGFLTTRLRQAGVPLWAVFLVSVAIRASYHAEYGFGVLGPVLFGTVLTLFYLRTRRLLPLILAHAGVDVFLALTEYAFV